MGTRVVRDGLLESEAVLSLPPEGRWLYLSILLSADDYGLFEATPFKLAKRADLKVAHVPLLLESMADVDLVRLYCPDARAVRAFGVVTKFGQRLRGYRSKHPLPPSALVADQGDEYLREFNKLAAEKSDRGPPPADRGRPETETETETDSNPIGLVLSPSPTTSSTPTSVGARRKQRAPTCPAERLVEAWNDACTPALPAVGVLNLARRTAVAARWAEVCNAEGFTHSAGLDWFRWLFAERVAASAFLTGRSKSHSGDWRCSWDWVMRPTNFAKVVDGNYVDRKGNR